MRLAFFTIASIGVVSAAGTIVEAKFNDAEVANKLVYQSPWMYAVLGLLIIQLIAVMIDRWPWKQHHAGFVLAHIGIIVLLGGAWMTQQYGIDGSMAFAIGESRDVIQVKDRDILVFASLGGEAMRGMYDGPADFLRHPPSEKNPFTIQLGQDQIKFTEHYQFAFRESEIVASEMEGDGPAIRFQLENPNVNVTQWLRRERGRAVNELDLGPARVVLTDELPAPTGRNEIIVIAKPGAKVLDYVIYNKDKSLRKKGTVAQADTLETGWMGLKFRLLRYLPHAAEIVRYIPASYSTPMTTSAAKFTLDGKEYWVGLNAPLRIFLNDRAYIIVYGNRQIKLGFPIQLAEFRMGKYQGTERAATYESDVNVPQVGRVTISMNEPLKHAGFTFYQSSFEQDERGQPTMSILSVNKDPGRWVKYLGSFLIVLGSVVLFYFKRVQWLKMGAKE